jgi:hypothetical protein
MTVKKSLERTARQTKRLANEEKSEAAKNLMNQAIQIEGNPHDSMTEMSLARTTEP